MESRKGKKASDDRLTPDSSDKNAPFSSAVSGSGLASKFDSHATRSDAVMSPSMYLWRHFSVAHGVTYSLLRAGMLFCLIPMCAQQSSFFSRHTSRPLSTSPQQTPYPNKCYG